MSKRWAALPQGIRWLAGIAVVVLALVIVWALFVPLADWLARHDVGSVTGSLHETAVDNARGRLLTLAAGLFVAGGLVYTARSYSLSREGQVADRYTKAIGQLGSKKKLDVRIGGIYALERVARDSARDHPTVMEVLTAFIRDHSLEPGPPSDHPASQEQARWTQPDVQAAVTVVARRDPKRDLRPIDLTGAYLEDAHLGGARLRGARLDGAYLDGAYLDGAYLDGAYLDGAYLDGAYLDGAILDGARLRGAHLGGAHLHSAFLSGTDLTGAHLEGADLTRAYLDGAFLGGAHLRGAILDGAHLEGLHLDNAYLEGAYLASAHLSGVAWPANTPVPEGWKRDTGSGRLAAAGSGSAQPEGN